MDDPDPPMLLPDLDAMGMVARQSGVERLLVGVGLEFFHAQEFADAVAEI
jgi:hypothetical protein